MALYISLLKYTQKGMEKIKETPQRLEQTANSFRAAGAELKAWYLLLGQYDALVIAEAPDDKTVAKLLLATGMEGHVRTETSKAFTEDEFRQIVSELP